MLRFASQHPEQFQFLCEAPMTHDVALDLLREVSGRPTCLPPTRWNNNLRFTGDPRRTSIPDTDGTILEEPSRPSGCRRANNQVTRTAHKRATDAAR